MDNETETKIASKEILGVEADLVFVVITKDGQLYNHSGVEYEIVCYLDIHLLIVREFMMFITKVSQNLLILSYHTLSQN